MQRIDGRLLLSASDLSDSLECAHLLELERLAAYGEIGRPERSETAELLARKGGAHETRELHRLRAAHGERMVAFAPEPLHSIELIEAAAAATIDAMRDGASSIAGGCFFDGTFFGRADFLRRVERPSAALRWSYEVVDTKLAASVKPNYLVQLAHYSAHLTRIQGVQPAMMHVLLGSGAERSFRVDEAAAYERQLRAQLLAKLAEPARDVYPVEVAHCDLCAWQSACSARRLRDDHLSLVARIRHDQIAKLESAGIRTVAQLASAPTRPTGMEIATFETLRAQAAIQVRGRTEGRYVYDVLDASEHQGFALLPEPNVGDLFFDIEGDPLYAPQRGLEYLFGFYEPANDRYTAFWARSHDEERSAFEAAADFIAQARARNPGMHVYHYAPYETSAMRRLMGFYATRERTIDDLLRNEVFVDLYAVVRQSLRISQSSYSIKKLEPYYGMERSTSVRRGDDSIVMFESWLAQGDDTILADIERYNEDDCRSTCLLLRWLHEIRAAYIERTGRDIAWKTREEKAPAADEERSELALDLLGGIEAPQTLSALGAMSEPLRARWLLGNLIEYHAREAKPGYWKYYDRLNNRDRLQEFDHEALAGLEIRRDVPARKLRPQDRSLVYTYRFPEQLHNLGTDDPYSPDHEIGAGHIVRLDDDAGELDIKLNGKIAPHTLRALIPGKPLQTTGQREALVALATLCRQGTLEDRHPAVYDLLLARHPRTRSGRALLQPEHIDAPAIEEIVNDLNDSYLAIQGPPGSGKSTLAAEIIVARLRAGRRVGIAARGHKAIHHLLGKIETLCAREGLRFRGLQKFSTTSEDSQYHSAHEDSWIVTTSTNEPFAGAHDLGAGTPWLFTRAELEGRYDDLFIDEAGQLSIADALACARAARNVILLGDPLQLKSVSQGSHPTGTELSILQHILGTSETIPPERGIFLDRSYRMAPPICDFISSSVYEGRLHASQSAARHTLEAEGFPGCGLYFAPVEHDGNTRSSDEEAQAVVTLCESFLAGRVNLGKGERALVHDDLIVVAPYNAQRKLIRRRLDAARLGAIRVGTVDKFQGQEAAVVLYSMATSNAASLPRDLEFLFERNRLNVAISRAQCASVLIASPDLLGVRCSTPQEVALVNLLCRFAESATRLDVQRRPSPV